MKTIFGALLILILGSAPAWATLGQYESSVSTDQKQSRSQERVQTFQAYRVHELATANGTTIREYVSPQGLVFGVTWQGSFMPDLQQLLGNYATNLQTAPPSQTEVRHLRGLIVRTEDFVFVSGGHARAWTGHAYVPSLLPSNVSVEVMQ
jgi:hypothetical protein